MARKRRSVKRAKRKGTIIPSKVPCLHVYYDLESAHRFDDDTAGEWHVKGRKRVIRVADTQDEPQIWAATFWHEWFHGAFSELGYPKDRDSEAKVEGLAHAITGFIADPHGRALLKAMLRNLPEKSP